MKMIIGKTPGPNGLITFEMDGNDLLVTAATGRQIIAADQKIKETDSGKFYLNVKDLKLGYDFQEIEIQKSIINARDKLPF